MRNSLLMAVASAALLTAASPTLAKGTFVPVLLPGSESTTLFGINDKNMISGQ